MNLFNLCKNKYLYRINTIFFLSPSLLLLIGFFSFKSAWALDNNDVLNESSNIVSPETENNKIIPGSYIILSLKNVESLLKKEGISNFKNKYPVLYNLGGINSIYGFLIDNKNLDILLIGKYDPAQSPITLDDLAVSLQSRFLHKEWPLVSIDPINNKFTKISDKSLKVRYEGGIENTQFGFDFFLADFKLKQIGMGIISPKVENFLTAWDYYNIYKNGYGYANRMWFKPIIPILPSGDDIYSIKELKVGVFAEKKSLGEEIIIDSNSLKASPPIAHYVKNINENYQALSEQFPSFSRLRGLFQLMAISHLIDLSKAPVKLDFLINQYKPNYVKTPRIIDIQIHEEKRSQFFGLISRRRRKVFGGVISQIKTPITYIKKTNLEEQLIDISILPNDTFTLKNAILSSRPSRESLNWSFIYGKDWLLPIQHAQLDRKQLKYLVAYAVYINQYEFNNNSLNLYNYILENYPDQDEIFYLRGLEYLKNSDYYSKSIAIEDFTKSIEINPNSHSNYLGRCLARTLIEDFSRALDDCNRALALKSTDPRVFEIKGDLLLAIREYELAFKDFSSAIALSSKDVDSIYMKRALSSAMNLKYTDSIRDINKAIEINPVKSNYYHNLSIFQLALDQDLQSSLHTINQSLKLATNDISYYHSLIVRGVIYSRLNNIEEAINDFSSAIEFMPYLPAAYVNRAKLYKIIDNKPTKRVINDLDSVKYTMFDDIQNIDYIQKLLRCINNNNSSKISHCKYYVEIM